MSTKSLSCSDRRRKFVGRAGLLLACLPLTDAGAQTFPTSRTWTTWPFSQSSPWNMPIGSEATFAPITASGWSSMIANVNLSSSTVSVVTAKKTDPLWDLYDNSYIDFPNTYAPPPYNNSLWYYTQTEGGAGTFTQSTFCQPTTAAIASDFLTYINPSTGLPYAVDPTASDASSFSFLYNPWSVAPTRTYDSPTTDYKQQFYMPSGVCGSPDHDGWMTVIQPTHYGVDLYSPVVIPTSLTANATVLGHGISTFYDLKNGDGTGKWNGRRASMIPTIAGLIRTGEIANLLIPHALSVGMSPIVLTTAGGAVWPAWSYDIPQNGNYSCTSNCLQMGSLLAIPPGVSLSNILTPAVQALAVAAQTYGVYIVDTNGTGGVGVPGEMTFMAELNDPDIAAACAPYGNQCFADLQTLLGDLQQVTNNSSANPGGPGTHSPLAPPFSD